MPRHWILLYLLFTAFHLGAGYFLPVPLDAYLSKPLPLLTLGIGFLVSTSAAPSPFRTAIAAGLILSLAGDILLLFGDRTAFFIAGLAAFLGAHAWYFRAAWLFPPRGMDPLRRRLPLWLPFLIVLIGLNLYLWPDVPAVFKAPVVLYSVVIILMGMGALNLALKSGQFPARLFFLGAILFILSDSLIAINKFKAPIADAQVQIMSTYLIAQLCIATGAARLNSLAFGLLPARTVAGTPDGNH